MIINLLKKIDYIYEKKLFVIYLLFFILIILLSSIYSYTYLHKFPFQFNNNNQLILKNLPFGYGGLVESLFDEGKYQQEWYGGVQSYLVRFPLLPLLVTGLLLSVVLIGTLASYFAKYIKQHRWLGWVGIGVIFIVALQLIVGGLDSLSIITINDNFRSLFHV